MTDIVERLLSGIPGGDSTYPAIMTEAAKTIESLRAEIEFLKEGKKLVIWQYRDAAAEVERLRVQNIQMQAALGYAICAEDERHIIPSNPFKCGVCDARNKWPNLGPDRQANVAERLFGDD